MYFVLNKEGKQFFVCLGFLILSPVTAVETLRQNSERKCTKTTKTNLGCF